MYKSVIYHFLIFSSFYSKESTEHQHTSVEKLLRELSKLSLATRFETYPASQSLDEKVDEVHVDEDISTSLPKFEWLLQNDLPMPAPRLGK